MVEGLYIRLFTRSPKQPLHTPTQSFVLVTRARAERGARTGSLLTNLPSTVRPQYLPKVANRSSMSTSADTSPETDSPVTSLASPGGPPRDACNCGQIVGMCAQRGDRPIATQHGHLCHTYASLCVAAAIRPIDIAELTGHRDVKTTLTVYAHLINTDDHAGNMAALGALVAPKPSYAGNVVPLHG